MKFLPKTISNKNVKSNFLANLPSFSNVATFTSVAGEYWTVPSGVNIIWVKLWGGGGAGGGATGGGGGFVSGYIKTKPGEKILVIPGGGGANEDRDAECEVEPFQSSIHTSAGGQASRVQRSFDATPYVQNYVIGPTQLGLYMPNTYAIAGGGGGGRTYNGGAGGGSTAQSGSGSTTGFRGNGAVGTLGGSAPTGGVKGQNAYTASIVNVFGNDIGEPALNGNVANGGGAYTQTSACSQDPDYFGSEGGSGYAGGSSGGIGGGPTSEGGGGGGSSFLSKDWLLLNVSGSGGTVANNTDVDYTAGTGNGGTDAGGQAGRVIIRY